MKKKIVIKRKYKNERGEMIESMEEISSDSPEFRKMFDDLAAYVVQQNKMGLVDIMSFVDPSRN